MVGKKLGGASNLELRVVMGALLKKEMIGRMKVYTMCRSLIDTRKEYKKQRQNFRENKSMGVVREWQCLDGVDGVKGQ